MCLCSGLFRGRKYMWAQSTKTRKKKNCASFFFVSKFIERQMCWWETMSDDYCMKWLRVNSLSNNDEIVESPKWNSLLITYIEQTSVFAWLVFQLFIISKLKPGIHRNIKLYIINEVEVLIWWKKKAKQNNTTQRQSFIFEAKT